jgi:hypothetical protein
MPLTDCPAFRIPPTAVQLAHGGDWENCRRWDIARLPDEAEIARGLAGREEMAFELFGGTAFCGVRFTGSPATVGERIRACFAAARAAHRGADFFAELSARTGLTGWGAKVDFAEVGAVNAWKSTGAVRAEGLPAAEADFAAWWQAIARSPVARETAHPKAVEFACSAPTPHWFALPISAAVPPYAPDRDLLRAAVRAAAGVR